MLLYYITDRKGFPGDKSHQRAALLRRIAEAARAGVDYIQLREKDLATDELEELAREVVTAVRENSATARLLINTHVDIALAVGADGVHLPAGSPPANEVRACWLRNSNREPLIGVSAHSADDLRQAVFKGASFAVLAPIFEKAATGAKGIGVKVLRQACLSSPDQQNRFTLLALGGVTLANARSCLEAGAAGVAGIRLFQQGDVAKTVIKLRAMSGLQT
ncbi:MAG TPA: thiamine phosphate synthase [Terriglobales bacterium]